MEIERSWRGEERDSSLRIGGIWEGGTMKDAEWDGERVGENSTLDMEVFEREEEERDLS